MDIKELMLGDLVVYKGEPMKVVFLADILEECLRLAPLTGHFCTYDCTQAELNEVEPLPITNICNSSSATTTNTHLRCSLSTALYNT